VGEAFGAKTISFVICALKFQRANLGMAMDYPVRLAFQEAAMEDAWHPSDAGYQIWADELVKSGVKPQGYTKESAAWLLCRGQATHQYRNH
jgi:hypothetical protein